MELLKKGEYRAAFEALTNEIEEDPENVELRIQLAELYIMFDKLDVARKVLEDALEFAPLNPTLHTDLGIVHEQSGRPSEALLEQVRAVELSPDHPTAHNNLGHTYLSLGIPRKANEYFKKAVLVNTTALLDLKSRLGLLPKWGGAKPEITREHVSALTFYLENAAYAYMGLDNRGMALESVREALAYDPESEVLKQKLESIESGSRGMKDDVKPALLEGGEIIAREKTARMLLLRGNTDDSGALLEDMLSRGVESASIRAAHGIVLQAIGDVEGAVEEYKKALKLDPKHLPALANLGFISEYRGLFDDSVDYYNRALKIEPGNAMLHNNIGHAWEMAGNHEKALAEYNKALDLDPKLAVAAQNIAGLYLTKDMLDKALEALSAALTLGPPSPAIYNNIAYIHNKQFNKEDAKKNLEEGLKLYPGHRILERNLDFLSAPPDGAALKPKAAKGSVPTPAALAAALKPVTISFPGRDMSDTPRNLPVPLPEVNESQTPEASEMLHPFLSSDDFPQEWQRERENVRGRFLLESGEGKIWLAEPAAKRTEFIAEGRQPAVSPDGGRAALARRAGRNLEIRLLSLDGSGEKAIVSTPEFKKLLAFSGDGAFLAWLSAENLLVKSRLWIYSFKKPGARVISGVGAVETYAWAPGTHRITALASECPDAADACLADINVDTGEVAWINPIVKVQNGGAEIDLREKRIASISVSPNNGELLIVSAGDPGAFLAADTRAGSARYIKIEKPDGDAPLADAAAWSPDGESIAFTHRGDIWTAPGGGGVAYPAVWGYFITGRFTWIVP